MGSILVSTYYIVHVPRGHLFYMVYKLYLIQYGIMVQFIHVCIGDQWYLLLYVGMKNSSYDVHKTSYFTYFMNEIIFMVGYLRMKQDTRRKSKVV